MPHSAHRYANIPSIQAGVEQLFNQLLRPKLRTFISDIYKDVSYVLDDDSYAAAELQDTVRKRFIKAWEALIDGYKVRSSSVLVQTDGLSSVVARTRSQMATSGYSSDSPSMCSSGHGRNSRSASSTASLEQSVSTMTCAQSWRTSPPKQYLATSERSSCGCSK